MQLDKSSLHILRRCIVADNSIVPEHHREHKCYGREDIGQRARDRGSGVVQPDEKENLVHEGPARFYA